MIQEIMNVRHQVKTRNKIRRVRLRPDWTRARIDASNIKQRLETQYDAHSSRTPARIGDQRQLVAARDPKLSGGRATSRSPVPTGSRGDQNSARAAAAVRRQAFQVDANSIIIMESDPEVAG